MRISGVIGCAVAIAVTGCQGGVTAPYAAPERSIATLHGEGSWISPAAKQQPLIYASDTEIYIYTYSGKLVGELKGFDTTHGLCSDTSGDVYVMAGNIYEYARGGTLPIDILQDPGPGGGNSCAVDPTTGNLAVANAKPVLGSGGGALLIYPPTGSQVPVAYTTPAMDSYMFCGYDSSGNLYVDGVGQGGSFQLAMLPKGGSSLVSIPLKSLNNRNHRAGGLQWDGTDVAVDDALSKVIYRIAVSGSSGTVEDTIHFDGYNHHEIVEFYIQGKSIMFSSSYGKMVFFKYPAGGGHTKGFFGSVGAYMTVSLPPS